MKDLGDEAEAFFRSGDEGTYEGGPASILPFVVSEELTEDWDLQSADEWLERRRRLKRFVATVVGGLSAGLMILSMCLLAARSRGADDLNPRRQAASLPEVTRPPVVAPALILPAPSVAAAQPDEPVLAAQASVVTEPSPSPTSVEARSEATRSKAPASPRRTAFVTTRAKAARNLPRGSADLPLISGVVAGPTAAFSN